MSADAEDAGPTHAVVLDYLPRGRPDDDRPQYQKSAVAHALGEEDFRLLELSFEDEPRIKMGDRIVVDPPEAREHSFTVGHINYDDLSSGANSELEYAVEDLIDADEQRFVEFYNEAQPITTRLHVLNLLPGIGKKLRNNLLDERKREPFDSFEDIEDRVAGLHRPKEVLVERILEELQEEDLKYRVFARREE